MKNLAFAIATLFAVACGGATETEIEDLATDVELATDVFDVTKQHELDAQLLSADERRERAQTRLVELGVLTETERAALVAIFADEMTPADFVESTLKDIDAASPLIAVLAVALDEARTERPDLDAKSIIASALRQASRGAQAGFAAGGKRGAAFAALVGGQNALVRALTN